MKSWRRLKELTGFKDKSQHASHREDVDEIGKAMQDAQELRLRYEGLHAVSSRVAGRAYGFSEAIQELANFLANPLSPVDGGGETSQVFKEVSRVQAELSKLLHVYALHVSESLTLPSESLLNELDHIQAQKRQYDQKRQVYENMRLRRSKLKSGKVEEAKEQYDELAMILGCRLHSLEQGRARNLMTRATRHHAAQLHLFRQCLSLLEDIDPLVNQIVHERSLEQSVDYGDYDATANPGNQMKDNEDFDPLSNSSPSEQGAGSPKPCMNDHGTESAGSKSAPISPLRFSSSDGINSIHEVLHDGKFMPFTRTNSWMRRRSTGKTLPHSTRLYSVTEPAASPARQWTRAAEADNTSSSSLSSLKPSHRRSSSSSRKKISSLPSLHHHFAQPRQLVPSSGPLPQGASQAGDTDPLYKSGPLNSTPNMSPSSSPPRVSPPRVNELHKLPPPPLSCTTTSSRSTTGAASRLIPHSAPLSRPQQQSQQQSSMTASPLPPPPLTGASINFNKATLPVCKTKPTAPLRKNEERVSPLPMAS